MPAGAIPSKLGAGSTGGSNGRVNKYINNNYTPPNRKPTMHSPAGSIGSNNNFGSKKGSSPVVTMNNQNRLRRVNNQGNRSPSLMSDSSKKSIRSSGYGKTTP